jgi:hypothetical protein
MEGVLQDWFYELGDTVDWPMLMSSALVVYSTVVYQGLCWFLNGAPLRA